MIPCSYWALTWLAALPSCITLYEISVRQTRDLPVVSLFPHPASFRFHLTMDTLAFGYILPTTGWIRDFNPLETCAAGHTSKIEGARSESRAPSNIFPPAFLKAASQSQLQVAQTSSSRGQRPPAPPYGSAADPRSPLPYS